MVPLNSRAFKQREQAGGRRLGILLGCVSNKVIDDPAKHDDLFVARGEENGLVGRAIVAITRHG